MTAFSLAISTPLGIFAAIWLVEYAHRGSKLVKVVRVTTETLQGIPSIVYGLFGMLFFVTKLHWGYSHDRRCVHAGHHGSARHHAHDGGGADRSARLLPRGQLLVWARGKLRTVFTIVLPSAVAKIPSGVFSSTRTLAVHMYLLSNEGLYIGQTYGTAVVLLVLVLVINCLSGFLAGKLAKK